MPIADLTVRRQYQRKWVAERRAAFFAGKCCVDCGSTSGLELDHVDPSTKVHHAIWSWSEPRRLSEIAKCVVRCRSCHSSRHAEERKRHGIKRYEKGCRCEICRTAKSESNRRYRESKQQLRKAAA